MIMCTKCFKNPETVDDRFYHVRLTPDGRDNSNSDNDEILCDSCFIDHITEHGALHIQSAVRIENPITA